MTPNLSLEEARTLLNELYGNPLRDRMSPAERVKTAIDRRIPDRVPFDFWGGPAVSKRMQTWLQARDAENMLGMLGVDIRGVTADYIGPVAEPRPGGVFVNQMGAHKRRVANPFGEHEEYVDFPLADCQTVAEVETWKGWPRPEYWDWTSVAPKIRQINRVAPYYIRFDLGCMFESAWKVFGLERFLTALYDKPEIPCAIMDGYTDLLVSNLHNLMRHAEGLIDMVVLLDDIATQTGLMMSPAMWRRFILPRHQRLCAAVKRYDVKLMYHTCGSIYPLIGALVHDLSIDVLNPLQPNAANMDMRRIKQEFGNQIAFHGGVDIQTTLPRGTPEQVQAEVSERCQVLGAGGGYICAPTHLLQMDTPPENIVAMYTAPR